MSDARQTRYAEAFANVIPACRAFAFWKGRVALYAILRGLGVGEQDEVIVPGYTCVMAISPIKYAGARPAYVDIEPETFNMDVHRIESAITPRTKLIIAQHTYGYLTDMDAVMDIAGRHGLPVVEDCCLALGSRYKGRLAGTFGVAAYFSSQWNKLYTTGLGGTAICHDEQLAARIEELCDARLQPVPWRTAAVLAAQLAAYRMLIYPRTTALMRRVFRWLVSRRILVGSSSSREKQDVRMPDDFFMGMSAVQAASGLRQLSRLSCNLAHRRKMAALYETLLAQKGWPVRRVPEESAPVLVRYPVRVADKWRMLDRAAGCGIELGAWFESPLHPRVTKLELYDYHPGMCPEAEKAVREVVNLPLHPRTSEATIHRTVDFITGGRAT